MANSYEGEHRPQLVILAVSVGSVMYRLIVGARLEQTAALFVGIPAVLAILLAMMPKAKTVKGGIMKGLTLALLLSGPILGEGFICILMASLLFYVVGFLAVRRSLTILQSNSWSAGSIAISQTLCSSHAQSW
jgi:hypothetical protein